ncbi:MAG: SIS domain-containing protein [Armatimonadetes bacterium]|nr:SIS domain-containing protein [Armatimonadota bacterium]
MPGQIENALLEAARLLEALRNSPDVLERLNQFAGDLAGVFQAGNKVMACGNGGSMADAMHFCEEWTGRFQKDRRPYPALALSEASALTCISNDYGYQQVFARQVAAYGQHGDILLLLSTSGQSTNLVEAAREARQYDVRTVGFLGRGGGDLAALCDLAILFPGEAADRIQELHMLALHAVIAATESLLGHG